MAVSLRQRAEHAPRKRQPTGALAGMQCAPHGRCKHRCLAKNALRTCHGEENSQWRHFANHSEFRPTSQVNLDRLPKFRRACCPRWAAQGPKHMTPSKHSNHTHTHTSVTQENCFRIICAIISGRIIRMVLFFPWKPRIIWLQLLFGN